MEGFVPEEDCFAACDSGIMNEIYLQWQNEVKMPPDGEAEMESEAPPEHLDCTSEGPIEKHISIVSSFEELENLAKNHEDSTNDLGSDYGSVPSKLCPLCPKEQFRATTKSKLHRHLLNLHWQVSVEYAGYKMCICHLHCPQMRPNDSGNTSTAKMTSHYHCIMCSATICRRTNMVSHMKQHAAKGQTKVRLNTDSVTTPTRITSVQTSEDIQKEADTNVHVLPNYTTPQKTDSFFNPKMKHNRQLIFCALAALVQERTPVECLDAFGSTGIMGLQWAKHLKSSVKVTINDFNEKSVEMIRENCHINNIEVINDTADDEGNEKGEEMKLTIGSVEVTMLDANVLMHSKAFDFIHLDPFGTTVNFLDAAFRNVRNLGIVSVTSTDLSSLYGKALNVAKRHYGANIVRTEYFREMAARVLLSAVARAAARCNKGIDVLLSVALEHFILVVVRVLRGPTEADESASKIHTLIHCQWCEERIFKEGHMVGDKPYQQMPCNCHASMPGKSAIELGPMWSGTIFNTEFLRRMLFESVQHGVDDIQALLKILICEAECTTHKELSISLNQSQEESGVYIKFPKTESTGGQPQGIQGKRKRGGMGKQWEKRRRSESRMEHPCFYYSIHRHSIRGLNVPRLNKFINNLTQAGFLVSRTHFDPLGVRTNATLANFKSILEQHSTLPNALVPGVTSVEPQHTADTEDAEDKLLDRII